MSGEIRFDLIISSQGVRRALDVSKVCFVKRSSELSTRYWRHVKPLIAPRMEDVPVDPNCPGTIANIKKIVSSKVNIFKKISRHRNQFECLPKVERSFWKEHHEVLLAIPN